MPAKWPWNDKNSMTPSTLPDIRKNIVANEALTLDKTILGLEQFEFLKQIFPHQKEFILSKCANASPASLPLVFTGTFPDLFPWKNVQVEICLVGEGTARHAILRIPIAEPESAFAYLSQFSVHPGEKISPSEVVPTTPLESYLETIDFSSSNGSKTKSKMVFSTADFTNKESDRTFYPEEWKKDFPVQQVGKGLNFFADLVLIDELDGPLIGRLQGSKGYQALIDSDESGPFVTFTQEWKGSLDIKPLSLNLTGAGILLSLARGTRSWPRIFVEGEVTIGTPPGLTVTAEYNLYYPQLALSFVGFPSLKQLLAYLGLKSIEDCFPEALSQMLDIRLSALKIVFELNDNYEFDLQAKSVSEISFALTTPEDAPDIHLIKDIISLKPTLEMSIYAPFDEESRSIEGDLKGAWTLDGIKFTTELSFPSLDFNAGMDPGQSVSTEKIVQRLLPGIDLPIVTLKAMEVEGNFSNKSFSADISAEILDKKGKKWGISNSCLEEIRIGMAYANQQMTGCAVECRLKLGEVSICISAEHDAGQDGLQFEGAVDAQTPIRIDKVITDLGKLFGTPLSTVPPAIESFTIEALKVSFNTQSKDFTFNCDGHLKIEGGSEIRGTVAIDVKHRQDGSLSTHFSGQLTIGDLQFTLVFDSSEKDKQLLAATYHDLQGQPKKIKNLVEAVSPGLAQMVPPGLEFTLRDALLGCHKPGKDKDAKWLFGVDIEGGLNLSDIRLPDFPLLSQFALPAEQTLKLAVQVVGVNKKFERVEVAALNALSPGAMKLPDGEIEGLALAASLRLGQECKQLSLPIGLKKNGSTSDSGNNPLDDSPASAPADLPTASRQHSAAQAVSDNGMQWVMIQKSFGPVHFERVGIAYHDAVITGQLDAALSAGGLTIALDGLSVTSPLSRFDPTFSLRGLGIDYRNGPLEIGGSFLKQTMQEGENTYTSFAGQAVLRTRQLSLSAIGSYALKDEHPSLFIYAVLDYPLGGPSFFFVTGLAAGFGYNRALNIPTIEEVEKFPLIQISSSGRNGSKLQSLPAGQKEQQELLTDRLKALEDYIPRSVGEHFLAIGLRFTSFKKINSFALLTVKFGKALEFDLLGISTLSVPKVAEAQLALKATFNPESGFLGVRAQLTPSSHILSHACHLTGGFAFYSWFKDQPIEGKTTIQGGDFVLTLGGYHPSYNPPAHYPRVPRLGFNWQVDDYLQVKGDAYYAMTPHALMAGAHLEATWHKDQLKAWFTASADFLISWEPYHYDARLYVDLGATYTFDLFGSHTITADLGADLHLWGPEFSGEARIHWLFISFTVGFGKDAPTGLVPIKWEKFKQAFLPDDDQFCGIAVQQGLIRQMKDGVQERWIMNPKEFVLVTNSVIPLNEAREVMEIQGKPTSNPIAFRAKTDLAVRPVAVEKMQSIQKITITKEGEKGVESVPFAYTPVLKAVPAALWGAPQFTGNAKKDFLKPPDLHDDEVLIEETLAGFEIRPLNLTEPGPTAPFEPRLYETELIPDAFEWQDWTLTKADLEGKDAWEAATGDQDPGLLKKRDLVFKTLGFPNIGTGFLTTLP
jgi:hypothetical protein